MNVNLGILHNLTRAVLVLILVAVLVGIVVCYVPVIKKNEKMRRDILNLTLEIEKEEAINRRLRASIEAVSKDPKTLERLARERLGYARKGETIIRFEAASAKSPARSP